MNSTKRRRETHIRPDAAMEQRLLWIESVYTYALGMQPAMRRPSVIVRAAIDAYVVHLESILRREGDPAAAAFERGSILQAARGDEDLRVTVEQVTALPVRPLSDIVKDARAAEPKVIDLMRAEVARARSQPRNGHE